jgi:hypothetical protein
MPTISSFYGVSIRMHWTDHAPPHFHAIYGEDEAVIRIDSLEVIHGSLPRRAHALTLEWAFIHRPELLENWDLCATRRQPKRIPPLD